MAKWASTAEWAAEYKYKTEELQGGVTKRTKTRATRTGPRVFTGVVTFGMSELVGEHQIESYEYYFGNVRLGETANAAAETAQTLATECYNKAQFAEAGKLFMAAYYVCENGYRNEQLFKDNAEKAKKRDAEECAKAQEEELKKARNIIDLNKAREALTVAENKVIEAENKAKEETTARLAAEKKMKEETTAKLEAEKKAKEETTARLEAEKKAKEETTARLEAEKKMKEETTARLAAEKKAKEETTARLEAEKKMEEEATAKLEAEKKVKEETTARLEAEKKMEEAVAARFAAEKKAEEEQTRTMADEKEAPATQRDVVDQNVILNSDLKTGCRWKLLAERYVADGLAWKTIIHWKKVAEALRINEQGLKLYREGKLKEAALEIESALEKYEAAVCNLTEGANLQPLDAIFNSFLLVIDAFIKNEAYDEARNTIDLAKGHFLDKSNAFSEAERMIENHAWCPDYAKQFLIQLDQQLLQKTITELADAEEN